MPRGFIQLLALKGTSLRYLSSSKNLAEIPIHHPLPLSVLALHHNCPLPDNVLERIPSPERLIPFLLFYGYRGSVQPHELLLALTEEHLSSFQLSEVNSILSKHLSLQGALQPGSLAITLESQAALRLLLWELARQRKDNPGTFEELRELDLLGQLEEALARREDLALEDVLMS